MSKKRPSSGTKTSKAKLAKEYDVKLCSLLDEDLQKSFSTAYSNGEDLCQDDVEVKFHPFPHWSIKNFISDLHYVNELKEELLKMKFHVKENDLFQFHQSIDLGKSQLKRVSIFRGLLFQKFRSWLENTMKKTFEDVIDMSSAKYSYTDTLLCHDDQLEGRSVAFIYYLVPSDWTKEDGGCLDLFSSSGGKPCDVARSIVPELNSLVFFEVSEKSFHQVSEVLSASKCRVSISGWLHSKDRSIPPTISNKKEAVVATHAALCLQDEILLDWISPTYLNAEIVNDICEQFEENSEIQLKDFLLESRYEAILKELNAANLKWNKKGPPNERNYWSLPDIPACSNLKGFCDLIRSEPFFKLLTRISGLQLAQLGDEGVEEKEGSSSHSANNKPACCYELRKLVPGSYSLLHDEETSGKDYTLDAFVHFVHEDWDADVCGGSINYSVKDDGQELLTVSPMKNCLSLVYRDSGTWRFLKYINNRAATDDMFYFDVLAMYMEDGIKDT